MLHGKGVCDLFRSPSIVMIVKPKRLQRIWGKYMYNFVGGGTSQKVTILKPEKEAGGHEDVYQGVDFEDE